MNNILIGDVLDQLKNLADESVYCVVTSPPYYGLRDYGTGKWVGGSEGCQHIEKVTRASDNTSTLRNDGRENFGTQPNEAAANLTIQYRHTCPKCGAIRQDGQIGQEDTPAQYVAKLVEVFREVRRVLHPTGTLWLNLGDSYASAPTGASSAGLKGKHKAASQDYPREFDKSNLANFKPKDLMGIPWRVAFALQTDGWWLRSDNIWHKPNCLPESVTDRPTKAHEYVFLLTKSARYWYDQDAIREPHSRDWHNETVGPEYMTLQQGRNDGGKMKGNGLTSGRNKRTVWTIPTKPYAGAHFAVMPEELAETCIKAGCPPMICAECGEPWVRVVSKETTFEGGSGRAGRTAEEVNAKGKWAGMQYGENLKLGPVNKTKTIGFIPTCQCCPLPARKQATTPGLVLDPFFGAGTVGVVAEKLHRRWLGIELNPDYAKQAWDRLGQTQPGLPIIF